MNHPNIKENKKSVTAMILDESDEKVDSKRFKLDEYNGSIHKAKVEANRWLRNHDELDSL